MSEQMNDPFAGISGDDVNIDSFQQKLATIMVEAGTDPGAKGKAMIRVISELVALGYEVRRADFAHIFNVAFHPLRAYDISLQCLRTFRHHILRAVAHICIVSDFLLVKRVFLCCVEICRISVRVVRSACAYCVEG